MPNPNARPYGFWSLPGGANGIEGSVSGVIAVIDSLANVPDYQKQALKAGIAKLIEETDFNYVKVLAREAANKTETSYRVIGHFDIEASKKNL